MIDKQPSVFWEAEVGFHLSAESGEQPEMHDKDWEGHSPSSLGDNSSSISESIERSSDGRNVKNLTKFSASSEIVPWLNMVASVNEKMPPWTRGSFKRGVIRSMSVNDILMIKGLIDPGVYVEYMDLESFSHC
jgi:hypothetical protein